MSQPAVGQLRVPLRLLVGQTILVRMPGRVPTVAFLGRIRRGEVGGVVLYPENFGPSGPAALVAELQKAARQAGQAPLLIAVDQEGGLVKRLPGAPSLAPPEMSNPVIAEAQGLATAHNLVGYGIDVDLAPVLDVGRGGFITPRTFGATAQAVAARGVAFLRGLLSGGVIATAKHFPGLSYAATTTDNSSVVIKATRRQLTADLLPFRSAISAGVPLVMVSTATYPSLGVTVPAACSRTIVQEMLRSELGFPGVVITDALKTSAVTNHFSVPTAALLAIQSGVDMVLAAGTTSEGANQIADQTYRRLLTAAEHGQLSRVTLEAAYRRVLRLKNRLTAPAKR